MNNPNHAPHPVIQALAESMAWADRSSEARLRISGPDRIRFLHNLTTNDIKALAPGQSAEAFVTTVQGRTLALVRLYVGQDEIIVRTDAAALPNLIPHLQKYGGLDDVSIQDITAETCEFHLVGAKYPQSFERFKLAAESEPDPYNITDADGHLVFSMFVESRIGIAGSTAIGPAQRASVGRDLLAHYGGPEIDEAAWDSLRIEAGVPVFGRDFTEANLPQELARNDSAISFNKGCYLGQETVARLDALGHVNKILRRVRGLTDAELVAGQALFFGDKPAGTITSVARSLRTGKPIGLAMIRAAQAGHGTRLRLNPTDGAAEVEVSAPR